MACPYFVPREIVYDIAWPHPARLPLGAGWTGTCCAHDEHAPAGSTDNAVPINAVPINIEPDLIRDFCNLGYATACPHLPSAREWDAVRFSVANTTRTQITLCYVCELAHAPKAHGRLIYDLAAETWRDTPDAGFQAAPEASNDARVRRLAASYLQAYRARQSGAPD